MDPLIKPKMALNKARDEIVSNWISFKRLTSLQKSFVIAVAIPAITFTVLLRSSLGALVLSLLALAAGVIGSVFPQEIGSTWPFVDKGPAWSEHVKIFYWTAIAFATLYLARRIMVDYRVEKKNNRLVDVLRSMPPAGTLNRFDKIYRVTSQFAEKEMRELKLLTQQKLSDSKLREASNRYAEAVRGVLNGVLTLAHAMDGQPRARYAANIMIYKPVAQLSAAEKTQVRARLHFISDETDIDRLNGVLDLATEFSVTTDSERRESDNKLEPIALPIPKKEKNPRGGKYNALPGAPLCFQQRKLILLPDTMLVPDWISRYCNVAPSVIEEVREYFNSETGRQIRSVYSAPIEMPESGPFAVLNIHRDEPELFENSSERAEQFRALCSPFLTLIGELLEDYSEMEGESLDSKKSTKSRSSKVVA